MREWTLETSAAEIARTTKDILVRLAGLLALLAAPTWLLVVLTQVLLIMGARGSVPAINSVAVAMMLGLLVLPALVTYWICRRDTSWAGIMMLLGVIGMVLGGAAELLLSFGPISYDQFLFMTVMAGGMILMWVLGLAFLGFFHHEIPEPVGCLSVGVIIMSCLATASARFRAEIPLQVSEVFLVALVLFTLLEYGFALLHRKELVLDR